MIKGGHFLWLEGVFDDSTVKSFKTISAASNFWQRGFIDALRRAGVRVEIIGYPVERAWPFGRLLVHGEHAHLVQGFEGVITGYINLPVARGYIQYAKLREAVLSCVRSSARMPDAFVVFSCLERPEEETPAIRMARYMRNHHGIPWICIVADGAMPAGADRYVYLPWSNFKSAPAQIPSIHIDGGVAGVVGCDVNEVQSEDQQAKIFMYMGALSEHGGVDRLARAFMRLEAKDVQLWICGRGAGSELDRLAKLDARIKLYGFVENSMLDRLAHQAFAFVNPRPNSFAPNQLNYPSKLLHYLAYRKPVLSTFTDGVSPEYAEVLVPIEDESEDALVSAMKNLLAMPRDSYDDICRRVERFNETHTWDYQTTRFLSWLAQDATYGCRTANND